MKKSDFILRAIKSFPFPNPKKTQRPKAKRILRNLMVGVNGCYDYILMTLQFQPELNQKVKELIKEEVFGDHRSVLYFFCKNSFSLPFPQNFITMEASVQAIKDYTKSRGGDFLIPLTLLAVMEASAFYSMQVLGELSKKLGNTNLNYSEGHSTLDEQHSKDMLALIDELNPPAQILEESIRLVLEWKRAIFQIS